MAKITVPLHVMLLSKMKIRRIREIDVHDFVELWEGVYREGGVLRSPPPPIDRIALVLAKVERLKIPQFVAVVDNTIIASMEAFPGTMCCQDDDSIGFLGAQVRYDYRRNGIGQALLETIIQDSRRFGFTELKLSVFVSNIPAQKLYEKFGFQYSRETTGYSFAPEKGEASYNMSLLLNEV